MRTCANCGTSLDGYRPQAIYCGGPCRAAASRKRAAEKSRNGYAAPEATAPDQSAQKRTQRAGESIEWESLLALSRTALSAC